MNQTLWLFIGRLNPPHIGHINIIKKALAENDNVLLLLWDNWIKSENNPLLFTERKILLDDYFQNQNLKIQIIEDDMSDQIWTQNIWKAIQQYTNLKTLNIYGGDFKNDSAIQVLKQYEKYLETDNIAYKLVSRENSKVVFQWQEYLVSSTNLRQALREQDYDLIKLFVEKTMYEQIINIKIPHNL